MEVCCPLCKCRITENQVERSLVQVVNFVIVHNFCIEDYKLRTGKVWKPNADKSPSPTTPEAA